MAVCVNSLNWDFYSGFLGCRFIDMAESLCQKRALEAFRLDPAKWGGKILYSLALAAISIPWLCHMFLFYEHTLCIQASIALKL